MSYIGKRPIRYSTDIKVVREGDLLRVQGRLGELSLNIPEDIILDIHKNVVNIQFDDNHRNKRIANSRKPLWGTYRSLINNMIIGVSRGYSVQLQLIGVGYRVTHEDHQLSFKLGYSHDVVYSIPSDINVQCPKPTSIVISGIDKQLVYQVASNIRKLRRPDAYKGKGIRYYGENIKLKEGKKK